MKVEPLFTLTLDPNEFHGLLRIIDYMVNPDAEMDDQLLGVSTMFALRLGVPIDSDEEAEAEDDDEEHTIQ